jgi:nitrate reductase NapE component
MTNKSAQRDAERKKKRKRNVRIVFILILVAFGLMTVAVLGSFYSL